MNVGKDTAPGIPVNAILVRVTLFYIISGSVNFSIGHTDYSLSGGDVFITMPNQVHSTNSLPLSLCKMYWFQLEDTPERLLYLNPDAAADLLAALKQFDAPLFHTDSKDLYPLIKSAFDSCVRGNNPCLAGIAHLSTSQFKQKFKNRDVL